MTKTNLKLLLAATLVCGAAGPPAKTIAQTDSAASAPWILDSNNWEAAQDFLPEQILRRVKNGDYWFKVESVGPAKFKRNYSEAFWKAGEANRGKYTLDPETCGLKDISTGEMPTYFFGYPRIGETRGFSRSDNARSDNSRGDLRLGGP